MGRGKGITIRRLPSGAYHTQVSLGKKADGSRNIASITAWDEAEVLRQAAELKRNHKQRKREGIAEEITVGEALERYIKSKENVISPSSIVGYDRQAKRILGLLSDVSIFSLTDEVLQRFISADAQGHKPKTVKNDYGLLHAAILMFRHDFMPRVTLPQPIKAALYTPEDSDVSAILREAKRGDFELYKAILISAFGSLRRSEICALVPSDIQGELLVVSRAVVKAPTGEWIVKAPKTESSHRVVALSAAIVSELEPTNGYIVDLRPDQLSDHFRWMMKRLDIHHFRFHDLRHYQASILHAIGIPDRYIMERGGWKSDVVLKRHYEATLAQKSSDVASIANEHFEDLLKGV
jgi:integrase